MCRPQLLATTATSQMLASSRAAKDRCQRVFRELTEGTERRRKQTCFSFWDW